MLNFKVIGAGAAGNKAAIALVEKGNFNKNNITLINSTPKDIPEAYKANSVIFGKDNGLGGCGKERNIGRDLFLEDMKAGRLSLDPIVEPDTNAVIIVSSTEGGSGSAISPIIAKYIRDVLGTPVIMVLLFGFNSDVRGMRNSIEICQELQENYGVIAISNAKFAELAKGNIMKAEQMANEKFVEIVEILSGKDLTPGIQNIDDTDLFKIVTTPGYMMIEISDISKIKNVEQYNKTIQATIDESVLIDCSVKGAKRIGIIYDASISVMNCVDTLAEVIKETYGIPYEMFTHISETERGIVTWIATGMPLPVKEIQSIYDSYLKNSENVNKEKDGFFDTVTAMRGNQADNMFDMLSKNETKSTSSKADFFANFNMSSNNLTVKTKTSTVKKEKDAAKEY